MRSRRRHRHALLLHARRPLRGHCCLRCRTATGGGARAMRLLHLLPRPLAELAVGLRVGLRGLLHAAHAAVAAVAAAALSLGVAAAAGIAALRRTVGGLRHWRCVGALAAAVAAAATLRTAATTIDARLDGRGGLAAGQCGRLSLPLSLLLQLLRPPG